MANPIVSRIPLPELEKDGKKAVLVLRTAKTFSGITSNAVVNFIEGNYETHRMFSDFSKNIITDTHSRATQKTINAQHFKSFTSGNIAILKEAALVHYGIEPAIVPLNPEITTKYDPELIPL
jgi:hypothetical protein